MPIFNLPDHKIQAIAQNPAVFQQVVACYAAGGVNNFPFDPRKAFVAANVSDGRTYGIQVAFQENGSFRVFYCTCPAYKEHPGACKHIIALLMYIDSYLRQANLPGLQRNKAFKQLVQSILEPQDAEFEIPPQLQHILRDYQKTGFQWPDGPSL